MIIIDSALNRREAEGNPILVGIIGAGVMGKGIINQLTRYSPGIKVAAVFNRTLKKASDALKYAGVEEFVEVNSTKAYERAREQNKTVTTQDIDILCQASDLEVLIEVTGTIEFATRTMLKAFEHGKNVLSFNAEIDATLGPILKYRAKRAGVQYSVADGDQPGVTMNLYRQVKSMGFEPLLCGNVKGLQDRYRNPTTQKSFASKWEMTPEMVTSFADGTKISFEQACVANATGMGVAKRGMLGYYSDKHVDELTGMYDIDELRAKGGIVDYVVGPKPGPGVFIYAAMQDEFCQKYLRYMKLGDGPLYCFYVPYHLLFFEIANSVSRLVDFKDDILSAKGGLSVEVITVAKKKLNKGEVLDGIGAYMTYGLCENYKISQKEGLLPMGLAEGCTLLVHKEKDEPIQLNEVLFPENRISFDLWEEQNKLFNYSKSRNL